MSSYFSDSSGSYGESEDDWDTLIHQAKRGCEESFQAMVERIYGYLILVAGSRIRRGVQGKFGASDIVQDGLSQAHKSFDQFEGTSEAEFRAWVRKIVVNNLHNSNRLFDRKKREVKREHPLDSPLIREDDDTPSQIAVLNEEKLMLQRYFDRLPALEQRVIELRHRYGYQHSEIARILGIGESAVKSSLKNGIDQLKRWFKENEGLLDSTEISFE